MRRVAAVLALLVVVLAGGAEPAQAVGLPNPLDCKDAPSTAIPGGGVPGFFDPKPSPIPAQADPFAANPTTSIYQQAGYAGLRWHTYDLGVAGVCVDMDATLDTLAGNALLGFATAGVAAANGLHNRIANPASYMTPIDKIVEKVSGLLKDLFWTRNGNVPPMGYVALLVVVMSLFARSSSGNYASVAKSAAWAVLVVSVTFGLAQYPARASAVFDNAIVQTIGTVNTGAAGMSGINVTADPAQAQGAQLVDELLFNAWLRGMFSDPDGPAAQKWGPRLFAASTASWSTAEKMKDPAQDKTITERKAAQWKAVMAEMQTQDPRAYETAGGKGGGRAGAGFMAVVAVTFTTFFRIVADLFMFAGLVMLRLIVMFFPALAVVGVLSFASGTVRRVANIAGASVVNVVLFGVGATIHTALIGGLLNQSGSAAMNALTLFLSLIVTVVAFVLLKPYLTLRNIVGMSGDAGWGALIEKARARADDVVTRLEGAVGGAAAGVGVAGGAGAVAGAVAGAAATPTGGGDSFTRPPPSTEKDPPPAGDDYWERWAPRFTADQSSVQDTRPVTRKPGPRFDPTDDREKTA